MGRKIVITSGKGGVGKTTVTANLGRALATLGVSVVLVDVDFGLNNLDVVLGVENQILYDLQDVLDGKCRVKQALVQDKYKKNLFILPSGRVDSITKINGQNLKLIIDSFINVFDYVLIDAPAANAPSMPTLTEEEMAIALGYRKADENIKNGIAGLLGIKRKESSGSVNKVG